MFDEAIAPAEPPATHGAGECASRWPRQDFSQLRRLSVLHAVSQFRGRLLALLRDVLVEIAVPHCCVAEGTRNLYKLLLDRALFLVERQR
jgi:hypothetical protein